MSDIRTKLFLGTSIGALAMIFVMASGVNVLSTESGIAAQSGMLNGHVTLMAVHPDGSMSYAQGDNVIIDTGKTVASQQLFNNTLSVAANVFECIQMGSGAEELTGAAGASIGTALGTSALLCASAAGGVSGVVIVPSVGIDDPATTTITVVFPALVQNDLIPATPGSSVTITEVTLGTVGGQLLSSVGLDVDVVGVDGTVVTIAYEMTVD